MGGLPFLDADAILGPVTPAKLMQQTLEETPMRNAAGAVPLSPFSRTIAESLVMGSPTASPLQGRYGRGAKRRLDMAQNTPPHERQ